MRTFFTKIVVVAIVVGVGVELYFLWNAGTISEGEAKQLVADDAVLVDVRTSSEFTAGHIEGAANIPVDHLAERFQERGASRANRRLLAKWGA